MGDDENVLDVDQGDVAQPCEYLKKKKKNPTELAKKCVKEMTIRKKLSETALVGDCEKRAEWLGL